MPKINLSNPETRAYFLDVTRYWLREFKIDGWRMDVARHVVPDFWDDFRRAAKEVNPDCYLLAEIWGNTSPWLQGTQFDATMNYFFRDLVVDYFAGQKMDTATFLDGVNHMLALYAPQVTHCTHNLFSSHDVTRFLHRGRRRHRAAAAGDAVPADHARRAGHLLRRRDRHERRRRPGQPPSRSRGTRPRRGTGRCWN